MVFSSISFIFLFLPFFLFLDRVVKGSLRNFLLIAASLLFYIWGEGYGVVLLVVLSIINLGFGKLLTIYEHSKAKVDVRKFVLFVGVSVNLGILLYYKYLFWIVSELSSIIPYMQNIHVKEHALPLGISFFTFHAISYLVDIYKGIVKTHSSEDFLTYFFMFPHLVAGPIVRFEGVRENLQARKEEGSCIDKTLFSYGVFRFVLGVNKKVLIANSVAPLADLAFYSWNPSLGAIDAWIGALAYTVQIYFDFSGYSDMAIGLAAMMGVRFDENFRAPYKSDSIKEFWRRWHISLSSWLRDYLYFPLGGSRCSKICTYRNLLTVFILCGLWHGAQFTFLAWGLFHGGLLILERTKFGALLSSWPSCARRCYCMLMVVIGWVLFRAENLSQAIAYIGCMFDLTNLTTTFATAGWINLSALVIGLITAVTTKEYFTYQKENARHYPIWLFVANLMLFFVSIAVLYTSNRNPFIYFNF